MQSVKIAICARCLKYYVLGKDHYCVDQEWAESDGIHSILLKTILEELLEIKGLLCQQTEMMEKQD